MALLGQDTLVTGPLPDGAFLLETLQGREVLGKPFRYDLTLLCEDYNVPVGKVLGQSLTVRLKLDSGEFRYFNGIVTSFSKVGSAVRRARYAVVLNPILSLLDCARSCRVFNDTTNFDPDPEAKQPAQNAIDIVKTILGDLDVSSLEVIKVDHVYRDRRYCVQYRETDLNFVQRLLEDEGIYYFFLHEDGHHTMVMADHIGAHTKVPGYESILYLPKEHKEILEEEHFWSLTVAGSLFPGKFSVLRGYNYTKPRPSEPQVEAKKSARPQSGQQSGSSADGGEPPTGLLAAKYEDYDYPGGLSDQPPAEEEAQVRMQTDLAANTVIEVEGNTMGLGLGDLVTLRKAPAGKDASPFWTEADFEQEYLITSATYSISINQYETGDASPGDEPFRAKYTLLDTSTQFRPQRTAVKPRIEGPQTAIVVGASGDEIYTDKLGRVKVQFDWDREHERDQKSSCWVRVAQVWAGKHWGAMHIPRVGQEVIVEFLDGDPDRPIITGRVYNADCTPPYALPDNKTQSGIKSRSSKGGTEQNFNEIRFEDLKDKEELHIQAERDMSTHVKRNQSAAVDANRSVTVGGTQSTTVTKSETQTYSDIRKMTVAKTNTDEITGDHTGTYKANRTETVTKNDALTVDANKTVDVHGEYNSTADKQYKVVQGTNMIFMKGSDIIVNNGKCEVNLSGGDATVTAPSSLTLQCGGATITLKQDGTIEVNGSQKVALGGGGSTVGLDASGATMSGMKAGISGAAVTEITGALIKIN
jgi:type VI secretion system secreted protein VgrG